MAKETRTWAMVTDARLRPGEDNPANPNAAHELRIPYVNTVDQQVGNVVLPGKARQVGTHHGMWRVDAIDPDYDLKCAAIEKYVAHPAARYKFQEITEKLNAKAKPEPAPTAATTKPAVTEATPAPVEPVADAAPKRRGRKPKASIGKANKEMER